MPRLLPMESNKCGSIEEESSTSDHLFTDLFVKSESEESFNISRASSVNSAPSKLLVSGEAVYAGISTAGLFVKDGMDSRCKPTALGLRSAEHDRQDFEAMLLHLKLETLLLELEKLSEERERIAVEKCNIELRNEILQLCEQMGVLIGFPSVDTRAASLNNTRNCPQVFSGGTAISMATQTTDSVPDGAPYSNTPICSPQKNRGTSVDPIAKHSVSSSATVPAISDMHVTQSPDKDESTYMLDTSPNAEDYRSMQTDKKVKVTRRRQTVTCIPLLKSKRIAARSVRSKRTGSMSCSPSKTKKTDPIAEHPASDSHFSCTSHKDRSIPHRIRWMGSSSGACKSDTDYRTPVLRPRFASPNMQDKHIQKIPKIAGKEMQVVRRKHTVIDTPVLKSKQIGARGVRSKKRGKSVSNGVPCSNIPLHMKGESIHPVADHLASISATMLTSSSSNVSQFPKRKKSTSVTSMSVGPSSDNHQPSTRPQNVHTRRSVCTTPIVKPFGTIPNMQGCRTQQNTKISDYKIRVTRRRRTVTDIPVLKSKHIAARSVQSSQPGISVSDKRSCRYTLNKTKGRSIDPANSSATVQASSDSQFLHSHHKDKSASVMCVSVGLSGDNAHPGISSQDVDTDLSDCMTSKSKPLGTSSNIQELPTQQIHKISDIKIRVTRKKHTVTDTPVLKSKRIATRSIQSKQGGNSVSDGTSGSNKTSSSPNKTKQTSVEPPASSSVTVPACSESPHKDESTYVTCTFVGLSSGRDVHTRALFPLDTSPGMKDHHSLNTDDISDNEIRVTRRRDTITYLSPHMSKRTAARLVPSKQIDNSISDKVINTNIPLHVTGTSIDYSVSSNATVLASSDLHFTESSHKEKSASMGSPDDTSQSSTSSQDVHISLSDCTTVPNMKKHCSLHTAEISDSKMQVTRKICSVTSPPVLKPKQIAATSVWSEQSDDSVSDGLPYSITPSYSPKKTKGESIDPIAKYVESANVPASIDSYFTQSPYKDMSTSVTGLSSSIDSQDVYTIYSDGLIPFLLPFDTSHNMEEHHSRQTDEICDSKIQVTTFTDAPVLKTEEIVARSDTSKQADRCFSDVVPNCNIPLRVMGESIDSIAEYAVSSSATVPASNDSHFTESPHQNSNTDISVNVVVNIWGEHSYCLTMPPPGNDAPAAKKRRLSTDSNLSEESKEL